VGILNSASNTDVSILFILSVISSTLVFLPILLPFRGVGFIHPLVFPLFLSIGKDLFKSQGGSLIGPLLDPTFQLQSTVAFIIGDAELLNANYLSVSLRILGLTMLYLGYFSYKPKLRPLGIPNAMLTSINYKIFFPVISIFGILGLLLFLQSQGGLTAYFSSWGTSRSQAQSGLGPILGVLKFLFIIPLTWYVYSGKKIFTNPIFISIFVISLISGFLTTGSRSTILTASIPFIIVWIYNKNKIPILTFISVGVIFFLLFGVLGKLRSSVFDNQVDWEILTEVTLDQAFEYSTTEAELWEGTGASIAVYHAVPNKIDYLYGKPYLAAIFFWIPRNIWEDKPHSTGYYTGRLLFGRTEGGIPPGEVADVYFNFGGIGIVILFFIKGLFIGWLSSILIKSKIFNQKLPLIIFIILLDIKLMPLSLVDNFQSLMFFLILINLFKYKESGKVRINRPLLKIKNIRHSSSV